MKGKFVVKTGRKKAAGFLNAVSSGMKLQQIIQGFKKATSKRKKKVFVTEWDLTYHEVLDISKIYSKITRSTLAETDATTLNKESQSKNIKEYYDAVKQVFDFSNE